MKKAILLIIPVIALLSCRSNQKSTQEVRLDTIAPVTRSYSNTSQPYIYEGTLPATDGPDVRYHLTINDHKNTEGGSYILRTTYLQARNGKDETFTTRGTIQKLRGSASDENALIYKLIADDESEAMYFMKVNNETLRQLNENLEALVTDSNLNYDIVLIN